MGEMSEADHNLAQEVVDAFKPVKEKYRNFFVTVYLNKQNRTVVFQVSKGELKKIRMDKIDIGED